MTSPATQVYRRSNALLGVAEQMYLLSEVAVPVLVNSPLDAFAIKRVSRLTVSRLTVGRWAGIPLCDTLLSAEQAGILGRFAATDSVVVALPDSKSAQRAAVGFLDDLCRFFPRVLAVELPMLHPDDTQRRGRGDHQFLHDALMMTRPLADYHLRRKIRTDAIATFDVESPDRDRSV